MEIPQIQITPGPMAGALQQMAQVHREKQQKAIENLLAQRKQTDEEAKTKALVAHYGAEDKRLQADWEKANKKEQNEAIPQINTLLGTDPQAAQNLGAVHGYSNFQQVQPQLPPMPGPAPAAPQIPHEMLPTTAQPEAPPLPEPAQQFGPFQNPNTLRGMTQHDIAMGRIKGAPGQSEESIIAERQGANDSAIADARRYAGEYRARQSGMDQDRARVLAERANYEQQLAAHPQQVAEHSARVDAYKSAKANADANPQWTAQGPNGPVTFSPNAARNEMYQRGVEYANGIAQSDPALSKRAMELAGMVKAGFLPPEKFAELLRGFSGQDNTAAVAAGHDAERLEAAKLKGKKGAGGGGNSNALQSFVDAAGQLKPGDPITPQIAALGRAAGLKPNQIATEVDKYRNSGSRSTRLADVAINGPEWKELYGPKGPGTQLERIQSMSGELRTAIASGDRTAATRVLEEAGGMLSGGKSTMTTVHLLEQLKSATDELSTGWGRIVGNPGDSKAFTERLAKLLDGAAAEKRGEVDSIHQRYSTARGGGSPAEGAPAADPRKDQARAILNDPARAARLSPDEKAKLEAFVK